MVFPFKTNRTMTATGDAIPVEDGRPLILLRKITGTERINEIYEYRLLFSTPEDMERDMRSRINLKNMINRQITVNIQIEGMRPGNIGAGIRQM